MPLPKKLKTLFSPHQKALRQYRQWVVDLPVDPHAVLLEQQSGLTLDGNIYCILRELLQDVRYADFKVSFVATATTAGPFSAELTSRGLDVTVLVRGTSEYVRALATCGVLITDNCFPTYYVKRPEQVLVNTWHGIPLKTLGRREATDAVATGNVQRNFALADYLLMPNPVMEERMVRDYMISGLSMGTVIPLGYPRNEAFLQKGIKHDSRCSYAWLPTFRGVGNSRGAADERRADMLRELDDALREDEVLYLKLHLVEREQVDFSSYRHILPAPSDLELYDFLATCDVLITDYSSVMFDFPFGGGKVVLFPYDVDEYLEERGLYDNLDTLPFPQVNSVEDLVRELRAPKTYDDASFLNAWWPAPTKGATRTLCSRLLLGEGPLPGEHVVQCPEKPCALVYSELRGDLDALRAELLELSKTYAVRLAFPWAKGRGHEAFLLSLPDEVTFTPLKGELLSTLPEKLLLKLGRAEDVWTLDRRRAFGDATFERVQIHDGTDRRWLHLIQHL